MKGKYRDLSGEQFGRLRVIRKGPKSNGRITWDCLCGCGNTTNVLTHSLTQKKTQSCGCLHTELSTNNLIGKTFGYWTVVDKGSKRSPSGYVYWICRCICGTEREVNGESLIRENSKSCGKCGATKTQRFCLNGHDTQEWGRTKSYACRACIKDKHLQKHYGITLKEFISLYEAQNGKCAVCQRELGSYLPKKPGFGKASRIEVDHDHKIKNKRKSVRGLLCGGRWAGCNRKLGKIDNENWLSSAAAYIRERPAQKILEGECS